MRALLHRLAHRFCMNFGRIVAAFDDRGTIWIGFKCRTCGRVDGVHASPSQRPPEDRFR